MQVDLLTLCFSYEGREENVGRVLTFLFYFAYFDCFVWGRGYLFIISFFFVCCERELFEKP